MKKTLLMVAGLVAVSALLGTQVVAAPGGGGGRSGGGGGSGSRGGGGGSFSGGGGGGSFHGSGGGGSHHGGGGSSGRSIATPSGADRGHGGGNGHSGGHSGGVRDYHGSHGSPHGPHHDSHGSHHGGGSGVHFDVRGSAFGISAGYHSGPPHHRYYGHWYHGDWHDHWHNPWRVGPVGWVSVGFASGAIVYDAPWRWGYWSYYNPYCTQVIVVDGAVIDYAQPIVVATPTTTVAAAPGQPSAEDAAGQALDAARAAFSQGDYATAMTQVNRAITKQPNDPMLHQFRGLILFATKQYKQAAGTVYAVLSAGPGWDWATLSSFYPSVEVYTTQLRMLEQYRNENLNQPEARFLLAYHYMSCGYNDSAVTELKEAVKLSPKDQLSAQLLAGLSSENVTAPPPTLPELPAKPVEAASLPGTWEASRSDGSKIALNINNDGTYAWKYTQQGKTQEFSGGYTVADNLLILKQNGNPTMIGQVAFLADNQFNFKLAGATASDPGLTFTKK